MRVMNTRMKRSNNDKRTKAEIDWQSAVYWRHSSIAESCRSNAVSGGITLSRHVISARACRDVLLLI